MEPGTGITKGRIRTPALQVEETQNYAPRFALFTRSKNRSGAVPPKSGARSATLAPGRCLSPCASGWKIPDCSWRLNPRPQPPFAMRSASGTHFRAISMMAASSSTTSLPKGRCVRSRWGVHCAPPSEILINIGSWPSAPSRHGRCFRAIAALTASLSRSLARIWYGASGTTC